MRRFTLKVTSQDHGLRIDQFIIKALSEKQARQAVSRSQIQRLIKAQKILVNQKPIKAHYKAKEQDSISIEIPEPAPCAVSAEDIPLDIAFEDESVLVINKAAGMVTHPAAGNFSGTLVNALLNYGCPLSTINGPLRPGIIHRLDKGTSGLIVVAKNNYAHQKLAEQFRHHTVKRRYIALVQGEIAHNEAKIDLPIARDRQDRKKMAVSFSKNAKSATTTYKVIKIYKQATLLELSPHTGRTHQLRVHLKYCGHPILGDERYGKRSNLNQQLKIKSLMLHAQTLGFLHPETKQFAQFQAEPPQHFNDVLKVLEANPA